MIRSKWLSKSKFYFPYWTHHQYRKLVKSENWLCEIYIIGFRKWFLSLSETSDESQNCSRYMRAASDHLNWKTYNLRWKIPPHFLCVVCTCPSHWEEWAGCWSIYFSSRSCWESQYWPNFPEGQNFRQLQYQI